MDALLNAIREVPPVRVSEVEAMQQAILQVALKLEEEGQLVIPGRGGEDALV